MLLVEYLYCYIETFPSSNIVRIDDDQSICISM